MIPEAKFISVTELSGDKVTQEQVTRMCERYYWAGRYCEGRDVLEVACGTGQGLGYIGGLAKSLAAGDYSEDILDIARAHYGNRIYFRQFDAQDLPFESRSIDRVILFEAIYYLPNAEKFVEECHRILRPGGKALIAAANKDLYDFNPSPFTHTYYSVAELNDLFGAHGFQCEFFGGTPVNAVSWRQRMLRPIKKLAVTLNLMPKTMVGKKLLKRLVFGSLVPMPKEITGETCEFAPPKPIVSNRPDTVHKVIYCAATLKE